MILVIKMLPHVFNAFTEMNFFVDPKRFEKI